MVRLGFPRPRGDEPRARNSIDSREMSIARGCVVGYLVVSKVRAVTLAVYQ